MFRILKSPTPQIELAIVSIIIPVFNKQDFVQSAIESALSQSYPHTNLIIIDDGSTDNSTSIINSYSNYQNVKIVLLPQNRGTLFVRSLGISLASEYVIFLDADDILLCETVKNAVEEITKARQDAVWFKTNVSEGGETFTSELFNPDSSFCTDYQKQNERNYCVLDSIQLIQYAVKSNKSVYLLWGKMFRTEILKRAVAYLGEIVSEKIVYSEDQLIFCALLRQNATFSMLDYVGYIYVKNSQQVTQGSVREDRNRILQVQRIRSICINILSEIQQDFESLSGKREKQCGFTKILGETAAPQLRNCEYLKEDLVMWRNSVCKSEAAERFYKMGDNGERYLFMKQCYEHLNLSRINGSIMDNQSIQYEEHRNNFAGQQQINLNECKISLIISENVQFEIIQKIIPKFQIIDQIIQLTSDFGGKNCIDMQNLIQFPISCLLRQRIDILKYCKVILILNDYFLDELFFDMIIDGNKQNLSVIHVNEL